MGQIWPYLRLKIRVKNYQEGEEHWDGNLGFSVSLPLFPSSTTKRLATAVCWQHAPQMHRTPPHWALWQIWQGCQCANQPKGQPPGQKRIVLSSLCSQLWLVFESENCVERALADKPIMLNGKHRLNVEPEKPSSQVRPNLIKWSNMPSNCDL